MKDFDRLVEIFERLRAPGGCPWDARQTHKSISRCAVEEAYELVDAIDSGNLNHLREELGDVLLQVLFHSTIAKDLGEFTIRDVINGLAEKLIYRHPHVFGTEEVEDSEEVIRNWERLKQQEEGKAHRESLLDGIPEALPALLQARKIQSKASRAGFDWQDHRGVIDKVKEEADELREAMEQGDPEDITAEIGDLLFSIVNLARFAGVDPESALRRTNRTFRSRFRKIEEEAQRRGVPLEEMSLQEMDEIWQKAKDEPSSGGCPCDRRDGKTAFYPLIRRRRRGAGLVKQDLQAQPRYSAMAAGGAASVFCGPGHRFLRAPKSGRRRPGNPDPTRAAARAVPPDRTGK